MDLVAATALAALLLYLAIARECAPRLLLPLAVGLLASSLPALAGRAGPAAVPLFPCDERWMPAAFLAEGVRRGFYGPLLLLGWGAATDFGPVLARPRLLAAAFGAQVAVAAAFLVAWGLGAEPLQALAAGVAGAAEAPTAAYLGAGWAPTWAAPAALSAYLWAALAPWVQPAVLRACTARSDLRVRTAPGRVPTRRERVLFPVAILAVTGLAAPAMAPLLGCFCLGNLLREAGLSDGLTHALRTTLLDLVTVLLGAGVGAAAGLGGLWSAATAAALAAGGVGVVLATAAGVLALRGVNRFAAEPVNPLVGGAALSPLADAARVVQFVGSRDEPTSYLLAEARAVSGACVVAVGLVAGVAGSLFIR